MSYKNGKKALTFCLPITKFQKKSDGVSWLFSFFFLRHLLPLISHYIKWQFINNLIFFKTNSRFLDSMYFSMVTISTVGFGDMPWRSQDYYKKSVFFLMLSISAFLFAMGTFTSTISEVSHVFVSTRKMKQNKKQDRSVKKKLERTWRYCVSLYNI